MSDNITSIDENIVPKGTKSAVSQGMTDRIDKLTSFFGGLAILFVVWWFAVYLLKLNPSTSHFGEFGPFPAFKAIPYMWQNGEIPRALWTSGYRLLGGLGIAILIGVPLGVMIGRSRTFRELSNSPFQLLRMISPLAWEPIAVIVLPTWDSAIIFLIAIASIWPVAFATAAGLSKVDPAWLKVAKNLGAKPWQIITQIIMPAIAFDILTGIRLALGVAWIVLVPAEFLGVTSGFGYSIQDARESLSYDHLIAMVLVIGIVGYFLDSGCRMLIRKFSWHRGEG